MENAQPEPSMEEILASIRRIISEDEEEQTSTPAAPEAKEPEAQKPELTLTTASAAAKPPASSGPLSTTPAATQPDSADEIRTQTEDLEMISKNVT
ncbi:MAG: DUF2497 domain-containing protein, partial [Pseudomonadota bacterium]